MIDSGARLRLVLRQPDGRIVPLTPGAAAQVEVDFVAFAAGGRFSGRIRLDAARMTDMLNLHEVVQLDRVRAEELLTGRSRVLRSVVLQRDDLYVVHLTGPRGDVLRRRRTIPRTLTVKVGRYVVTGEVHTEPGLDPLLQLKRKGRDLVPLTDAVVQYDGLRGQVEEPVDAVLVNRNRVEWARRTGFLA